MKSLLIEGGYRYDPARRFWDRCNSDRSDQSGPEPGVAGVIRQAADLTLASDELLRVCADRTTRRLMSPFRANILRPFAQFCRGRILEVGSGGGAITRYLGETGSEVVALEPDRTYAEITASRCRDLSNVEVIAGRLSDLRIDTQFDTLVLVGTLDQAGRYVSFSGEGSGANPALALLQKARELLKPEGVIILAAANPLGSHHSDSGGRTGRDIAMTPPPPGRLELTELLNDAGFGFQHWLFPFPDFTLPTTIVNDQLLEENGRRWPGMFFNLVAGTESILSEPSLGQDGWSLVLRNGLGADLAPSFLVIADRSGSALSSYQPDPAFLFTTDRKPGFARSATITGMADEWLSVRHHRLFSTVRVDPVAPVALAGDHSTEWLNGHRWTDELGSILSAAGWTENAVAEWIRPWFDALRQRAGLTEESDQSTATQPLPGRLIEALPEKMVVGAGMRTGFIDQDLTIDHPLELGFLLFRGLRRSLLVCQQIAPPAGGRELTINRLGQTVASLLGVPLSEGDLARYDEMEKLLDSVTRVGPARYPEYISELQLNRLPLLSSHRASEVRLTEAIDWCHSLKLENNQLTTRLSESTAHIRRLQNEQASLWEWIVRINANPLRYMLERSLFSFARETMRALPFPVSLKRRLRDLYFATLGALLPSAGRVRAPTANQGQKLSVATRPVEGVRDILLFAVIDWHSRVQRPQHIARGLAGGGRRVFYFSKHFVDVREPGYEIESLPGSENLYRIKLHVRGAPSIYFEPPTVEELECLEESLACAIKDLGIESSVSLIQHPYWYPLVTRLPRTLKVYDCLDHHEGFGDVSEKLVAVEKEMMAGVDLVTVTSEWLAELAGKKNQNVVIVRNAVEYSHFAIRPERIFEDSSGRRIIGYFGAIADWFDIGTVRAVALAFPECLILLVGEDSAGAKRRLGDLSNVRFTGEVPYSTLPYYLHAFDVCLLPFRVIPLTLATNPVKIYEYLAAGKPVVSTDLPETAQFGDLVLRASDRADFVRLVGVALDELFSEAEKRSAERRQFASEQTWRHRCETMLKYF